MLPELALLAAIAAPGPPPAGGEDEAVPTIQAVRLDPGERIVLDGSLDEPIWARAESATDFRQQEPREGAPATERTEVRVAFDRDNLYLGVVLYDSDPSGILGRQLARNAGLGADDRFMWILDTFRDGRTGYFFEINPAGLMGDGLLRGVGDVTKSWDGIWEARVVRGDHGWSAEIRIPFRTLNFDPTAEAWGVNFQRTVRRKNEETLWSGHGRNQGLLRPTHAGRLVGLHDISQGIGLEVRPYAVGSWQAAPGRGTPDAEYPRDIGMDVSYSITPSLRASLTLNTDFAEAEVDQRRVNLTRFPLVFPERRDFFLEGSGVHAFAVSSGPTPYFSRRIGLVGGRPVPVRLGGRLNGQAGAYEVGLLQLRTGATDFSPGEDFTVARVRRSFLRQSTIGGVYTRRASIDGDEILPAMPEGHTLGMDLNLFTSRFRGDRNLQFEAFFVWHSDPWGDTGTTFGDRSARGFRLNYPNDVWRMHISAREFGDAYEPPVGFVPRRGFRRIQPTVAVTARPDRWNVRRMDFAWQLVHLTDLRGRIETFGNTWTLLDVRFKSGDEIELRATRDFERLSAPFTIFAGRSADTDDDVVLAPGDYTYYGWEAELETSSRRAVSTTVRAAGGGFWSGRRLRTATELGVRPVPGTELGLGYERNDVSLPEGDFTTNLVRVAAGWHLSPWTSFTGNVQYDDVSRVVGVFTRLRWIVRPGSDVFLVYTHNLIEDPTSLERFRGLSTLDRRASTKVTYTHRF